MICMDCFIEDGLICSCDRDDAQQGDVCPNCERVWSPHFPKLNKHYATQRGYLKRLEKDGLRARQNNDVETMELVKKIIRPFDD